MKVYAIMYTLEVQKDNYKDLYITKDENNNPRIAEVFSSKEEAEEWITLNPPQIRDNYTVVELVLSSIKDYKD